MKTRYDYSGVLPFHHNEQVNLLREARER